METVTTMWPEPIAYDLDASLITVAEAAALARVEPPTIRSWVHRGSLTVADRQDGRPLFRPRDVLAAERGNRRADPARKRSARRVDGDRLHVQR